MKKRETRNILATALAGLALAWALPAYAEPSAEAAKAFSGVRFSETSGVPAAAQEAPAVYAERGAGKKAAVTFSKTSTRKTSAPESPAPGGGEPPKGDSVGTRILTAAGALAGVGALSAMMIVNPLAYAALVVGGALAGAAEARRHGAKGRQVASAAIVGSTDPARTFVQSGAAAGRAVGKFLERLF